MATAIELDVRGLKCPLPVLKARKRLTAMASKELLRLVADDPLAVIDVPHFCAEAGHILREQSSDAAAHVFVIEKK